MGLSMDSQLSRRSLLKGAGALSLAAAIGAVFTPMADAAATASPADLEALRQRWVDQLTGRTEIVGGDADFTRAIAGLDTAVQASVSLLVPDAGTRTQVFSDTSFTVDSQIVTVYKRLAQMATAWATPGSGFKDDAALLQSILAGLRDGHRLVYNAGQAEFGNWWSWEIGTPKSLTDAMSIVREHLTGAEIADYCAAIDHFIPDPTMQFPDSRGRILSEGANRVDICQGIIVRSIVGGDTSRLAAAIAALVPVWQFVTSGNGFFRDGSFIQHSTIAYTGTYGVVLLGGLAKLFSLLGGSSYAVTDPSRQILFDRVEASFAPLVYNGQMMDSVRGRAISRQTEGSHDDGTVTIEAILWLARAVDPATAARWQSIALGWIQRNTYSSPLASASIPRTALVKQLLGSKVTAAPEPVGHTFFPAMDRAVHRGNGWASSLGLSSRRMTWYECGNGENNTGYHTGDGMTYIYGPGGGEFDDAFWPTANLNRLPGITVDTTVLPPKVEGEWGAKAPQNEWTGGVTGAGYGAVGQHLIAPGSTGLSARKSWFFSHEFIVALGSDISTGSSATVESIVEHRNLGATGTNALLIDGKPAATVAGTAETHAGAKWAHLEGVGGYLFLDEAPVQALRESRSGSWKDINKNGTAQQLTRNYVTLYIDHGTNPRGAGYGYVLLPGATAVETAAAARQRVGSILRNDAAAQGIKYKKTTAANFWSAATVGNITAAGPASVLSWEAPGVLKMAVSDPTQTAEHITLTVSGTRFRQVKSAAEVTLTRNTEGSLTLVIPTAALAGQSVELQLNP